MKIRYYSHAHLQTGFGRAALDMAFALDRAGAKLEVVTMGPTNDPNSPWPLPPDMTAPIPDPDVVIVHTLPGDCHRVLEAEGLKRGAGPKLVAYTTWEALAAPAAIVQPLYEHFDQVWVPSQPTASAMTSLVAHGSARNREAAELRTHIVPHCFDELAPHPVSEYSDTGKFRFYWIGAWSARKNPGGLIRAFAMAFGPKDPVQLVMHSPGVSTDTFFATLAQTGLAQDELPAIVLSNQHISPSAIAAMHQQADCFVSATRGEAWNLPAFDALLAGRHCVTTFGLGSDDFLLNTSADLCDGTESPAHVDVKMVEAGNGELRLRTVGAQGLSARSLWLEPNLCSIADSMHDAAVQKRRDLKIAYDVAGRFGYAAVANLVVNVLEK